MLSKLEEFIENKHVQYVITAVILFNAVILGLMTNKALYTQYGALLDSLDEACLVIFTIELAIKLVAQRHRFFFSSWNIFDFITVGSSLVFSFGAVSALRVFRVFRLFKVISSFGKLRLIVIALIETLPSMYWISMLLAIIFYIYTILGYNLYGEEFGDLFGTFGMSVFTLFQTMTLESWASQIARPIMDAHPYAWIYFVSFTLITTFVMMNLVVGVVVESINKVSQMEKEEQAAREREKAQQDEEVVENLNAEIAVIREHLEKLETMLAEKKMKESK